MEPRTLRDWEVSAKRSLPAPVFDWLSGGAEEELTLLRNRTAFAKILLSPSILAGSDVRDLVTTVLGHQVTMPIMLAPVGLQRLLHPDGEVATATAAARERTVFALSTASSRTIEEIGRVQPGPRWFQLYVRGEPAVNAHLIRRAEAAGFDVLCVTADVPVVGPRDRDRRNHLDPLRPLSPRMARASLTRPRWLLRTMTTSPVRAANWYRVPVSPQDPPDILDRIEAYGLREWAGQTWDSIASIRDSWRGSFVIKGVLTADDAVRAARIGADAIVVSNHGGRQLDSVPASIEALPAIVQALKGKTIEIYLDGGVRRGTDVLKALALGAKGCFIGRPFLYGLAAAGESGVLAVLSLMRSELDAAMAMVGRSTINAIDQTVIATSV
jgi:L-lactate dehydrogenase (cytochrome)